MAIDAGVIVKGDNADIEACGKNGSSAHGAGIKRGDNGEFMRGRETKPAPVFVIPVNKLAFTVGGGVIGENIISALQRLKHAVVHGMDNPAGGVFDNAAADGKGALRGGRIYLAKNHIYHLNDRKFSLLLIRYLSYSSYAASSSCSSSGHSRPKMGELRIGLRSFSSPMDCHVLAALH